MKKHLSPKFVWFYFCLTLLLNLLVGAQNLLALTVQEERQYGDQLENQMRKQFSLIDAPDIAQYINALGGEILNKAGNQYYPYHFFIINNKEFNAFSAPAGHIFFYSGLIEAIDRENELISVLAHEVGHSCSRHIAESLEQAKKTSMLTAPLLLAGIATGGALGQSLMTGSLAAGASVELRYSREYEEEADRLACKWMQATRRDPEDMVEMLRKMRKLSFYRGNESLPYLSSHPQTSQRIGYIKDLLLTSGAPAYRKIDDFTYLYFKWRVLAQSKSQQELKKLVEKKMLEAGKNPKMVLEAQIGLIQSLLQMKNYPEAEKELGSLMSKQPNRAIIAAQLGFISFEQRQYQQALIRLKKAQAMDPDSAYTRYYLAKTLQIEGQQAEAISLYEGLISQVPDYPQPYFELGRLLQESNQKGPAYFYKGVYFWHEGNAEQARLHLDAACRLLPAESRLQKEARGYLARIENVKK